MVGVETLIEPPSCLGGEGGRECERRVAGSFESFRKRDGFVPQYEVSIVADAMYRRWRAGHDGRVAGDGERTGTVGLRKESSRIRNGLVRRGFDFCVAVRRKTIGPGGVERDEQHTGPGWRRD